MTARDAQQKGGRSTAPRKGTSKRAATKKGTSKRAAAKKTTSKSAERRPAAARTRSRPQPPPLRIAGRAAEQLAAMTGRQPEGVTGLEHSEDGWTVQLEVVEMRRIPATTDVLALYEVRTDERGELQSYRRLRRYARGASADE